MILISICVCVLCYQLTDSTLITLYLMSVHIIANVF